MDVSEAIQGRRSIRNYKKQPLPENTVEKIVDAARMAPSAGNVQPYEFVIAQEERTKQHTTKETFKKHHL